MKCDSMLSVIIPTYNEKENIRPLMTRLSRMLRGLDVDSEVIIVDDDSPDRTWEAARMLGLPNLMVIRSVGRRGLSRAILEGLKAARGELIGVMDADLSHPPEALPDMLESIGESDFVVASRYMAGGGVGDWPVSRRALSLLGRLAARPLTGLTDPMSGFFLARRDVVGDLRFRPRGFKILLDLIVRSGTRSVAEVPYRFSCRRSGHSKMDPPVILNYLFQVAELLIYRIVG
jgi:dolichol-phosphate mannosyltransferase